MRSLRCPLGHTPAYSMGEAADPVRKGCIRLSDMHLYGQRPNG